MYAMLAISLFGFSWCVREMRLHALGSTRRLLVAAFVFWIIGILVSLHYVLEDVFCFGNTSGDLIFLLPAWLTSIFVSTLCMGANQCCIILKTHSINSGRVAIAIVFLMAIVFSLICIFMWNTLAEILI